MDARLKYVSSKISELMGLDPILVGEYFRFFEEKVLWFLEGKGPDRILACKGNGLWSSQTDPTMSDPTPASTTGLPTDPPYPRETPFVVFCDRVADVRVGDTCVYFVRTTEGPVDPVDFPQQILCGELSSSVLSNLEMVLRHVFIPTFETRTTVGSLPAGEWVNYIREIHTFTQDLADVLAVASKKVDLRKPGVRFVKATEDTPQGLEAAARDDARLAHFEGVVEDWMATMERVLLEPESRMEAIDVGPHTELEYWKERASRLNSIVEQKNRKECKLALNVLIAGRNIDGRTSNILRRWRVYDNDLTDALSEAKENVRFLTQLEKFLEPLYVDPPPRILEHLPTLMNNIYVMQSVARYYNSKDKLTFLFKKISNQMVVSCKTYIESGGRNLWDRKIEELMPVIGHCLDLNQQFSGEFDRIQRQISTQSKGKAFQLDRGAVFEKFDWFCQRLHRIENLFQTAHQFTLLIEHKIYGLQGLCQRIADELERLRSKRYNLVDEKNYFDQDYEEFTKKVAIFELELKETINRRFECMSNSQEALELLDRLYHILYLPSLRAILEDKYWVIFCQFNDMLDSVQNLYERHKHSPPVVRNAPPVAGAIVWARQLYRRIEKPMLSFEKIPGLFDHREAAPIIRNFNHIARSLVEFETLWHMAWMRTIDVSKKGLNATLLRRDPRDASFSVNLDPQVFALIHESKCLLRLNIEIPESAKLVMLQEEKLKRYHNELTFMLREYVRLCSKVHPRLRPALQSIFEDLETRIEPGVTVLTWTSLNIDGYLARIHDLLGRLSNLMEKVNSILEERVEGSIKKISRMTLLQIKDQIFTTDKFVACQEKFARNRTEVLQIRNTEAQVSLLEIMDIICNFTSDRKAYPVDAAALHALHQYYRRLLFKALLNVTTTSFRSIKERIEHNEGVDPLFEVDVEYSRFTNSYMMNPSLDKVQEAINRACTSVLDLSRLIFAWGSRSLEDIERPSFPVEESFFPLITSNKTVVRLCLLLTGGLHQLTSQVFSYLETFQQFEFLFKEDKDDAYARFTASSPSLEDFENILQRYVGIQNQIAMIEDHREIESLLLVTHRVKSQLSKEAEQWKKVYASNFHMTAKEKLARFNGFITRCRMELDRDPTELTDVKKIMEALDDIHHQESQFDLDLLPLDHTYELLNKYHVLPEDHHGDLSLVKELSPAWEELCRRCRQKEEQLAQLEHTFLRRLVKDVRHFEEEVAKFRREFERNGPMVPDIAPLEAADRLHDFQDRFKEFQERAEMFQSGEELFGLPVHTFDELQRTSDELDLLSSLYDLYLKVIRRMDAYAEIKWVEFSEVFEEIKVEVAGFERECRNLTRGLRGWKAYKDLRHKIESFKETQGLLEQLNNRQIIQPRHWKEIMDFTGKNINFDEHVMLLGDVLALELWNHEERLEEVLFSAAKEAEIEKKLKEINLEWDAQPYARTFVFGDFKKRGHIILQGADIQDIQERLEETQVRVNGMVSSRFSKPFKDEVTKWAEKISVTVDNIERWLLVQGMWMSMEAVFAGGGDIAKHLVQESKLFAQTDKRWVTIMQRAFEVQKVVDFCTSGALDELEIIRFHLEKIQNSLSNYLEEKRNRFPRFYFVSDPMLLEILSQSSDPYAIQGKLSLVFDSIDLVQFAAGSAKIVAMISQEGETVPLSEGFVAQGQVEDWLNTLEKSMVDTMKDIIRQAAFEAVGSPEDFDLQHFINTYPAQVALLVLQFRWTFEVEQALYNYKPQGTKSKSANAKGHQRSAPQPEEVNSMRKALDSINSVFIKLTEMTQDNSLSSMKRRNIETLITIQAHQVEVFQKLFDHMRMRNLPKSQILTPESFDWQKQLRFYWASDIDECVVGVADVEFAYSFEYLGVKERLVITPLTDRCYITLSQALGMFMGGAPAGPAGTGKTETVKDLGRALGKYVVVTNCSKEQDHFAMGKLLKGCAQSGAWADFDEFNRISLDVLSVVAQQIQSILSGIRNRQREFVFTDGNSYSLRWDCGFFITMNPGYQGREELPENLKILFRGVTMMVPDREIIIRVKLASAGFKESAVLAKKFNVLYRLCEEQLSKQPHYDFGLRNILSVLRTAGAVRRANPNESEESLLQRTLRDMNHSKLVADDVPLLLSLINDMFSGGNQVSSGHQEFIHELRAVIAERKLVDAPQWVEKVVQLYETSLVRHGIMVIGPPGVGKSTIYECLLTTLTRFGRTYRQFRMNPKAILADQMFGEVDVSKDWTEGIFSRLWKEAFKRKEKESVWITCDGPVDAIWIENLNTVLDDNKMLTLANGDRLQMADSMKVCFEVEDLRNASPATVSRAGQIYVSDSVLGWMHVLKSKLQEVSTSEKYADDAMRPTKDECELIEKLFGEQLDALMHFIKKNCTPVMNVVNINQVSTCLSLMLQMIRNSRGKTRHSCSPKFITSMFIFAMMWSFGGLLEPEDRRKVEEQFIFRRAGLADFLPKMEAGQSLFDFFCNVDFEQWEHWEMVLPEWEYLGDDVFEFSTMFVPTVDSIRIAYLLKLISQQEGHALLLGRSGTAKSVTMEQFLMHDLDHEEITFKKINFSSATSLGIFQQTVEASLEKRATATFVPKGGKKLVIFIDDLNMPEVNEWQDQPTNELVRQVIEERGLYSIEKQHRGVWQNFEGLQYMAAMRQPGDGNNDIPNRLKRHFAIFNMSTPSLQALDQIFGQVVRGRFTSSHYPQDVVQILDSVVQSSISVWQVVQEKLLPTPSKFHYVFNLRDLSRIFQGLMECPQETIRSAVIMVKLWKHECTRVFADRLNTIEDKAWFDKYIEEALLAGFGESLSRQCQGGFYFVDFLRPETVDADGEVVPAPKVYELASVEQVQTRLVEYLKRYNEGRRSGQLQMVLFDYAVKNLVRISRVLRMPRGHALLVGVGGSGKVMLTSLASFISHYKIFRITLNKDYSLNNFLEELKFLYREAGVTGDRYTFIFSDKDIKSESFLEYINMMLTSGEIPGLFPKDELDQVIADMAPIARNQYPDTYGRDDSFSSLYRLFLERVRCNLHLVLSMSPVGDKFRDRARKFPGLISGCNMNWFFPWPTEALIDVATSTLQGFDIKASSDVIQSLISHMSFVHRHMNDFRDQYFQQFRRNVYVTPRSYLSYLKTFKDIYRMKLQEVSVLASKINGGLNKLLEAEEKVEILKVQLRESNIELRRQQRVTEDMLADIAVKTATAQAKKEEVRAVTEVQERDFEIVEAIRNDAKEELRRAMPIMERALEALNSIDPRDIQLIRTYTNPPELIKRIFDGVLILKRYALQPTSWVPQGSHGHTLMDSYGISKSTLLANIYLLRELTNLPRDEMDDEMVELLQPYLNMADFNADTAKQKSSAAAGLCVWVRAMAEYHETAKFVGPKVEALREAEDNMQAASVKLEAKKRELAAVEQDLKRIEEEFQKAVTAKQQLQEKSDALRRKMDSANSLLDALSGERDRWSAQREEFDGQIFRLVGDASVSSAFLCYCGPYNSTFREKIVEVCREDMKKRQIPVTSDLHISSFLVDENTAGEWNLQGLPKDDHSIQNGIMVTTTSRWPILVDPQGQGLAWLNNYEPRRPGEVLRVTQFTDKDFKQVLADACREGWPLIIENISETMDPFMDPLLDRIVTRTGSLLQVVMGDKTSLDYDENFRLYMATKIANPHFSPELCAKTTVIDFTVTRSGLEDQLLACVIQKERKELEDQRDELMREINANRKKKCDLEDELLSTLSNSDKPLLENEELISVLSETKATSVEVESNIAKANETALNITRTRESYRDTAARGSVLYFLMVEMSLVNPMYQTSLQRFLQLFNKSIESAEQDELVDVRVYNIIEQLTHIVYTFVGRGLFEKDKSLFSLLLACEINLHAGKITHEAFTTLLKGGASLNIGDVRPKPFSWIRDESWLNCVQLSHAVSLFGDLCERIAKNEANTWGDWYDSEAPEQERVPHYEGNLSNFSRLLLVRSLRPDRTMLAASTFISGTPSLERREYIAGVTANIRTVFDESDCFTPIIYLLSLGSDPTGSIFALARKKKQHCESISLGRGQEARARELLQAASSNGHWLMLQNCHLGLHFMTEVEDFLTRNKDEIDPEFRLWITSDPHPQFPIGLLQMSIKLTNEAPRGLKAGLERSFQWISEDMLARVSRPDWQPLLYTLCFLHSTVQERRKFGPLGFNIAYEFNQGDLEAAVNVLEKHLFNLPDKSPPSWETVRYMVCEIDYGGRITDDKDRRLFDAIGRQFLNDRVLHPNFEFYPNYCIPRPPSSDEGLSFYQEFVETLPDVESPELFGLHPNADLTFRMKESAEVLWKALDVQPKESTSQGGGTREEEVYLSAKEMLQKLPVDFKKDHVKEKLKPSSAPLNIFAHQEIDLIQTVLRTVRKTLEELRLAIEGTIVMSATLQDALNCIYDGRVPSWWSQISWQAPGIGVWFNTLLMRHEQLHSWVEKGRPKSFWLAGFFNPQGFLTAVKQMVTRKHNEDCSPDQRWTLDEVVLRTEVKRYEVAHEKDIRTLPLPPGEGVFIHGLYLEGARWNLADGCLQDQQPKILQYLLPVVFVTAEKRNDSRLEELLSQHDGPLLQCPVYKIPMRTYNHHIFDIILDGGGMPQWYWILRGVALLCSKD